MARPFIRPTIATFNRDAVPMAKAVRSAAPEVRGVYENLMEALRELRSCVFLCGQRVLSDDEIAQQACLHPVALAQTLPQIIERGLFARDDTGALFSTLLYDRVLRREEREARKVAADQHWHAVQQTGDVPPGLTRKQITARENGRKGGAPRKGETAEQRDARRARELAAEQAQRKMPLVGVVAGTHAQSNNPNQKPNSVSVIENSVISVPIDLELESDNTIPSNSNSVDEPNNPATEKADYTDAQAKELAARILTASGLGDDQVGFAISFARQYLGRGVCPGLIVRAVAAHKQKMSDNGEFPRRVGVFKGPIERAIAGEEVVQLVTEAEPIVAPVQEWQREAQEAFARSTKVFAVEMSACRDFGRLQREWPDIAARHGLPPVERTLEAYEAHFNPQSEQVAA
ncbi:MAG: hypothetical protein ABF628_00870 [Acetobacter orientalis]|uniref:hypothetical protein n=1 Tax=Acetobacter orientalis TaxID=146474 RepID=UPI0039E953FC